MILPFNKAKSETSQLGLPECVAFLVYVAAHNEWSTDPYRDKLVSLSKPWKYRNSFRSHRLIFLLDKQRSDLGDGTL